MARLVTFLRLEPKPKLEASIEVTDSPIVKFVRLLQPLNEDWLRVRSELIVNPVSPSQPWNGNCQDFQATAAIECKLADRCDSAANGYVLQIVALMEGALADTGN